MTVSEAAPFQREIDYFERHRIELLSRAAGQFALVKCEKLVGVFETEIDAVRAGYQQFGNEPFLVKQILEADVPLNFTAFNLGTWALRTSGGQQISHRESLPRRV